MKKYIAFTSLIFLTLLSGCLYPNDRRAENQVPYPAQVELVQQAVNQFQEQDQVLPIMTKEADTPLYEKYVIDFTKLVPRFLEGPPGNSFEKGGVFQYVLVDVETNPTVKLMDLRLTNDVRSLQLRLDQYLQSNYLPIEETIDGGYFKLDYSKLNLKEEPFVQSPYTMQALPFIVNKEGKVAIDYRSDLYYTLQEKEMDALAEEEDIRYILLEDSLIVPSHSFPYRVVNGEIVLQ